MKWYQAEDEMYYQRAVYEGEGIFLCSGSVYVATAVPRIAEQRSRKFLKTLGLSEIRVNLVTRLESMAFPPTYVGLKPAYEVVCSWRGLLPKPDFGKFAFGPCDMIEGDGDYYGESFKISGEEILAIGNGDVINRAVEKMLFGKILPSVIDCRYSYEKELKRWGLKTKCDPQVLYRLSRP